MPFVDSCNLYDQSAIRAFLVFVGLQKQISFAHILCDSVLSDSIIEITKLAKVDISYSVCINDSVSCSESYMCL